jgi:hypothetical protein
MTARSTASSVAGRLEADTQAFIDSLSGAAPIYTLSPEAARDVLAGAQKSVTVMLAPVRIVDRVLNIGQRRAPISGSTGQGAPQAPYPS